MPEKLRGLDDLKTRSRNVPSIVTDLLTEEPTNHNIFVKVGSNCSVFPVVTLIVLQNAYPELMSFVM